MAQAVNNLSILPNQSFALYVTPEDWTMSLTIASGTPEKFVVPSGANYVVFGATGNFCVRYNTTTNGSNAAFGDVTGGTGCEINPTIRYLRNTILGISVAVAGGSAISVSARFYK